MSYLKFRGDIFTICSFIARSRNTIVASHRTVPPLDPMTSPVNVVRPDGHTFIIGSWRCDARVSFFFASFRKLRELRSRSEWMVGCPAEQECSADSLPIQLLIYLTFSGSSAGCVWLTSRRSKKLSQMNFSEVKNVI